MMYGLFQKFIRFDERFRDTLWSEVDLEAAFSEVNAIYKMNIMIMMSIAFQDCHMSYPLEQIMSVIKVITTNLVLKN